MLLRNEDGTVAGGLALALALDQLTSPFVEMLVVILSVVENPCLDGGGKDSSPVIDAVEVEENGPVFTAELLSVDITCAADNVAVLVRREAFCNDPGIGRGGVDKSAGTGKAVGL